MLLVVAAQCGIPLEEEEEVAAAEQEQVARKTTNGRSGCRSRSGGSTRRGRLGSTTAAVAATGATTTIGPPVGKEEVVAAAVAVAVNTKGRRTGRSNTCRSAILSHFHWADQSSPVHTSFVLSAALRDIAELSALELSVPLPEAAQRSGVGILNFL